MATYGGLILPLTANFKELKMCKSLEKNVDLEFLIFSRIILGWKNTKCFPRRVNLHEI